MPSGVSSLDVTAVGAQGGAGNEDVPGGIGAQVVDSALPVGESELWVDVGQPGTNICGDAPDGGLFDGGAGTPGGSPQYLL